MANMVGQVLESHKITFYEDELPPEGLNHNKALHIIVQCEDHFITRVLINGGSSLNICPLVTLRTLGKSLHEIKDGAINVKTFDGSQSITVTYLDEPTIVTCDKATQQMDMNSEEDDIPEKPACCTHVEEEANGKRWFHDIKEYLTKGEYPELANPTQKCTLQRLSNNFFHSGGILYKRTPDLGLLSDLMKAMCETFKIKHKNSTAYSPQMNRAVEAANKNIKMILRKMIEKHKQWHEKLSFALLGYCTTVHTSTGATPYMLVYGTEVVIPTEVEIPSLRIIHEAKLDNAEWVESRYEQLALTDGKRMNAVFRGQLYHNRMSRAFNKRVKPR
ncbi:uncharacterized protein [Nicotiana sylvestris]|uniref:uncharacterized protein n=1 Tax=Nicotiana sylvestris TaxID=4096 RepID=UPI00388CE678